ncbi:envelope biogenesis factor ElyC [Alteromonas sp. a30]|uniref:envelope biogenesis factor ElyC n=1 Tax=Alteromonas sp. a30 TaxID=2730917 RepID=UPI0022819E25|nr:envelope biogenesis factor ElyC [Alteromonas sp. a30]MCY7296383.1 envelope biogenesis factor ElyC [Alteromonas sp. a30]
MDLFTIKKIVGQGAMPLTLLTIFILLGLYWSLKNQKKKAIFSQFIALIFLLLISNNQVAYHLLLSKEQAYKQFDLSHPVKHIVILGCGHKNDGMLPVTSQLASCSLYRLVEGIRIYKANPGARIVTSGYGGSEPFSNADMVRQVAISLGIPEHHITALPHPKDTEQEAKAIAPILGKQPFALVTSASHMPRAMAIFEKANLNPVAAPSGHLAKDPSRENWWQSFPDASAIHLVERWWYETLGSAWLLIKGD